MVPFATVFVSVTVFVVKMTLVFVVVFVVVLGGRVSVTVEGGSVSVVGGSVSVIVEGGRVSVVVGQLAWRGLRTPALTLERKARRRGMRARSCIAGYV